MNGLALILFLSCAAMLVAWLTQQRTKNAGIVDVFWAFGMAFAGGFYAVIGTAPNWMRITLAVLVVTWFLRLGIHIVRRMGRDGSEDGRYLAMRNRLGRNSGLGFFAFFQLQAGFIVLLSLPFLVLANTPQPEPAMVAAGVLVAIIAYLGESTADRQLLDFRSDLANRGLTCRQGLWRYSRHPNYFFEWLHWFSYPLMGAGGPYGHLLWLAPLVILVFLVFFTGIPFAEQQAIRTRGEDYRMYQKQTSAFIPWPPSTRV